MSRRRGPVPPCTAAGSATGRGGPVAGSVSAPLPALSPAGESATLLRVLCSAAASATPCAPSRVLPIRQQSKACRRGSVLVGRPPVRRPLLVLPIRQQSKA